MLFDRNSLFSGLFWLRFLIALFVFYDLLGCTNKAIVLDDNILITTNHTHIIKGIPFYPDTENLCGPSSLASVLNYWGANQTVGMIKNDIFIEKLRGTLNIDMENYARKVGFEAESYNGSIEIIKKEILLGRPLIAFINLGYRIFPIDHYLVIIGYNEKENYLITYSGKEKYKIISNSKFLKAWEKTNYWTLLIKPKSR